MPRDQLCGSMYSKFRDLVYFGQRFVAMPRFLLVFAGAPASDKKRPGALPPALADGLEQHGAALESVRACCGDNKWGTGEGVSFPSSQISETFGRNVAVANGFRWFCNNRQIPALASRAPLACTVPHQGRPPEMQGFPMGFNAFQLIPGRCQGVIPSTTRFLLLAKARK